MLVNLFLFHSLLYCMTFLMIFVGESSSPAQDANDEKHRGCCCCCCCNRQGGVVPYDVDHFEVVLEERAYHDEPVVVGDEPVGVGIVHSCTGWFANEILPSTLDQDTGVGSCFGRTPCGIMYQQCIAPHDDDDDDDDDDDNNNDDNNNDDDNNNNDARW
eukprot:CAMPEP_0116839444 /NCGR_PEP_ID=MMETSP0418-20121206/9774_1 /TAXON_ID=1158023 /ORGANISM="Astrosyne radiata, Strain 13vi08-1A" /LENGTH=158 /DNA_ID=CAMNT_0004469563 /DNA_START=165 /DNA_END=638 /DNA_ORIENTATION=+